MKILIATDGSEFSKAAIEESCQLALNAENTIVKIVSVFEQPVIITAAPYAFPVQYNAEIGRELQESAKQVAAQAEETVRRHFPDLKENLTHQILRGSPGQAIVEEAEKWGADLIVVGSHGYGFWERMFLGSVSSAIAHHAPCSVLIVRKPKSRGSSAR